MRTAWERLSTWRPKYGRAILASSVLATVLAAASPIPPAFSNTVSNYTATGISYPQGIAAGPDGALWFTNTGNNSIGRITTSGTVSNYAGTGVSYPLSIAAGPDGALWFTNYSNNSIGRITTSGTVSN